LGYIILHFVKLLEC